MKDLISPKLSVNTAILVLGLLALFHILILLGVLPNSFVWGAKTTDAAEIAKLETVALIMSLIFLSFFLIKKYLMNKGNSQKTINIFMWIMFIWFTFNIIGNILSSSTIEKVIFIPVSIILSLVSWRLALQK